jgi:hypothetical protein
MATHRNKVPYYFEVTKIKGIQNINTIILYIETRLHFGKIELSWWVYKRQNIFSVL